MCIKFYINKVLILSEAKINTKSKSSSWDVLKSRLSFGFQIGYLV